MTPDEQRKKEEQELMEWMSKCSKEEFNRVAEAALKDLDKELGL